MDQESPFLSDVSRLSRCSNVKVKVKCQSQTSEKCHKINEIGYYSATTNIEKNGKYLCLPCSRKSKSERDSKQIKNDDIPLGPSLQTSPFIDDVTNLKKGSHYLVFGRCQIQKSPKCTGTVKMSIRNFYTSMEKNDGKYVCFYCLMTLTNTGRNNPNCKYKTLDDDFMKVIDTEEKAYLLGWIASDGHLSPTGRIDISVRDYDIKIMEILKDLICEEIPIFKRDDMVGFSICSTEMNSDICKILEICPGNKSKIVTFPNLDNDSLTWAFIRGLFDGDGSINKLTRNNQRRSCCIASISSKMKEGIKKFCKIDCYLNDATIGFTTTNAMLFLSKIYQTNNEKLRLERKYNTYLEYLEYTKGTVGQSGNIGNCKYVVTRENADHLKYTELMNIFAINLVDIHKILSPDTVIYETGIKLQPDIDYCLKINDRNDILVQYGYILKDKDKTHQPSYVTTFKVTLIKVDTSLPNIELPFEGLSVSVEKKD